MIDGGRRTTAGALAARGALWALLNRAPGGAAAWQRTNHRGQDVSLLAGPALAVAVAATTAAPAAAGLVAGLGAGLVGGYDDHRGEPGGPKGFRGHFTALQQGDRTTGTVKVLGISAVGVTCAALLGGRGAVDLALGGAAVAGGANVLNLLDLRPGRALKVGLAGAVALGQPGIAGACAALLPADLGERTMLGDTGANALGATLGVGLLLRVRSRTGRAAAVAALVALTAASERVSFSAVIDRSPGLRWLDRLGRAA